MITINGAFGEGGGQILRSSLALSLVTGQAFRIESIRAGRKKPGLMRQHLTAVKAAQQVGGAEVKGAAIGSGELTFSPSGVYPGTYHFAVGTAGSATLVLQTVLPALLTANGPSRLTLEGGTHNPYAPPFDFLATTFLPLVKRMGPDVRARLDQYGFYPAGGGRFTVEIDPVPALAPLELMERGEVTERQVRGIVAKLPLNIAEREVAGIAERMSWPESCCEAEEVRSVGPGNVVTVALHSDVVATVFTGFGQKRVPVRTVVDLLLKDVRRYLGAGVPVGRYLADQLLVPLALAGGGRFRTFAPSRHTMTNIEVIKKFLAVNITRTQPTEESTVCDMTVTGGASE